MTLWILLGLMTLVAMGFALRPMLTDLPRLTLLSTGVIVVFAALSAGLYWYKGNPGVPSGAGRAPDIQQMVTSLAARLERQPDDANGWKMLGRSYMTLGDPPAAVEAFRKAVELESAQNAQTLVALGRALAEAAGRQMTPQAVSAFENALAIEPNNADALFWGGLGASSTGNTALAADRWERLLTMNPPAEVQDVLRQRIAEWRGEEPPPAPAPQSGSQTVVTANLTVGETAASSMPAEATVFVIARDPTQPSPPIAVTRRALSELPTQVELGDDESMIPGRVLSGFEAFELVARVSLSGSPAAQAGDWFGSVNVTPGENDVVDVTIDTQVQ